MGILNRVLSPVTFRSQIASISKGISGLSGIPITTAAKKVNESTALSVGSFYNAIDLASNDIAKLPKAVFQKLDATIQKTPDHPVHKLIALEPNAIQTSFNFWKIITYSALVKGDGFAYIERDKNTAAPLQLIYIDYNDVQVYKHNDKLYYKVRGTIVDASDILHIYFFSTNGYCGTGIITYAATMLGIDLSAQEFIGNTFDSKGLSHGVIESDHQVDSDSAKKITEGLQQKLSQKTGHQVGFLDDGLKYKRISITSQEAELIQVKKEVLLAVCQFVNIAPHKLKYLDQANYSNLQLMTIEHQQDSVMPRTINIEQELTRKLFSPQQKRTYYIKFNLRSMLRGDQQSESEYLTKLVLTKILTPNEARELIERNPVEGGDELLQPVNTMTEKQLKKSENASTTP